MNNEIALVPYTDMERMAAAIAKSGLFGMKAPEQALALMCVAQAEGRHPGSVASDYHIIQGRPALKADTMLARFQKAGGVVKWTAYTDQRVAAIFSHPQGGAVEIDWTFDRAKGAGLTGKQTWKQYPRQMLRARVISEGVRTVYPGVATGMYTPEEQMDLDADTQETLHAAPGGATIDGATGQIEQPQRRSEKASEPAREGPINEQQAKLLRATLEKKEISDTECCKKFGVESLDALPFAKLNEALSWAADPK